MVTYTFYASLVCVGLLSLQYVRRNHFELFYYAHHFAFALYVAVAFPRQGTHEASCIVSSPAEPKACQRQLRGNS